jgi:hypothetical protein
MGGGVAQVAAEGVGHGGDVEKVGLPGVVRPVCVKGEGGRGGGAANRPSSTHPDS